MIVRVSFDPFVLLCKSVLSVVLIPLGIIRGLAAERDLGAASVGKVTVAAPAAPIDKSGFL